MILFLPELRGNQTGFCPPFPCVLVSGHFEDSIITGNTTAGFFATLAPGDKSFNRVAQPVRAECASTMCHSRLIAIHLHLLQEPAPISHPQPVPAPAHRGLDEAENRLNSPGQEEDHAEFTRNIEITCVKQTAFKTPTDIDMVMDDALVPHRPGIHGEDRLGGGPSTVMSTVIPSLGQGSGRNGDRRGPSC